MAAGLKSFDLPKITRQTCYMKYLLTVVVLSAIGFAAVIDFSHKSYLRGYQYGFSAGTDIVQKNLWTLINRPGVKKCYKTTQN